jgi:hypothetical protein
MTAALALTATARVLTRWHNAGVSFAALDYLEGLSNLGHGQSIRRFKEIARQQGLMSDECFEEVAVAVWAGVPGWRQQVLRRLALPMLEKELDRSTPDLAGLLCPWAESPLEIRLMPEHVRLLANRCLGRRRFTVAQATALLDAIGPPAVSSGSESPESDSLPFWEAALRFWGTDEIVPALLVVLRLPPGGDDPSEDSSRNRFVKEVNWIAGILYRAGWSKDDLRAKLAPVLAGMLAAGVVTQPIPWTPLYKLLPEYEAVYRLFHESPTAGASTLKDVANWYRAAAGYAESLPDPERQCIRLAWGRDVALSFAGAGWGAVLVEALYQQWCCSVGPCPPCTDALVRLLVDARTGLHVVVDSILVPILRDQINQDRVKMARRGQDMADVARRFLETRRMICGRPPLPLEAMLLARLPEAREPFHDDVKPLADWRAPHDARARLVVAAANAMSGSPQPGLGTLLWEVLLSPPQRLPSLRARVSVALEQAHAEKRSDAAINALSNLLRHLHGPTP